MSKFKSKKFVVIIAALAIAASASLAAAAWLTGGNGNGAAKADTASGVTVTAVTPAADLYPGAQGAVKVSVKNDNKFPVQLTAIAGNGAITSDKGTACDTSTGVTYTAPTGLGIDSNYKLTPGETKTFTLANAVAMSNASDDACQGATFTVPVAVAARSAA